MKLLWQWIGSLVITGLLVVLYPAQFTAAQVNYPRPRAQVSFTFDDSLGSAITKAAPVLASQGYRGTEYVTTNFVGQPNYLTWDQVVSLKNNYGWEIGSHTVSHPLLTQQSAAKIESELANSKNILKSHGINATAFATPFGDYDNRVLAAAARHYSSHRPFHDVGYNTWPNNNYLLYVQQVQAGVSVDTVKAYINEAKANNKWLVLVFHDIKDNPSPDPQEYEYGTSQLQSIVNYTKSQGLPVVTVSEGLVTGSPNLLPNASFDAGISQGWTTDNPASIRLDSNNRGSYPSPRNSILLRSVTRNVHLFSPKINVAYGNDYILKQYMNTMRLARGEIGFYIDEYDANGNWVSGQYKLGIPEAFAEEVSFSYTPSSANVSTASLQVIVEGGSGAQAYLDNVQWYKVN